MDPGTAFHESLLVNESEHNGVVLNKYCIIDM